MVTAHVNRNDEHPQIRRRTPRSQRRRDGLIQFAYDNTSQNGEDGIIAKLFELIPASSSRSHRICVDVGAWDGKHLSNTYSLLVDPPTVGNSTEPIPWKGLLLEADTQRFLELEALHQPLHNTCCNVVVSGDLHSPNSLVNILKKAEISINGNSIPIPSDFDFLCIDVDGSDYWLLRDIFHESTFRPMVICIEANPTMPNDLIYIPPRNDNLRHGASVAALVELAEQFGYVLVETTVYNCFFVPMSLYKQCLQATLVPDTSIEALHEVTMGTSLYQLYDGTLKLWGCKRLLWHRMGINEEQIQVLPASRRTFPFAPETADDELPEKVVNMRAYFQANDADASVARSQCAAALLEQLEANGFALINGTGISQTLCQDALRVTNAFLQDADESVRRSCLTEDRARRGYAPMCTENFASLIGQEGPNDLVRKFRVGPQTLGATIGETTEESSNAISSSSPLHRPNVWPNSEEWPMAPEFQSTIESYYSEVCGSASAIVQAIGDGLVLRNPELYRPLNVIMEGKGAQDGQIERQRLQQHSSILTLLGYRTGSRHKKTQKKRYIHPLVASHTDVSF